MIEMFLPDIANNVVPLRVPQQLMLHMAAQVIALSGVECCGFLIGPADSDVPDSLVSMDNTSDTPELHYEMDPDSLIQLAQMMEDTGQQMFAAWHSHVVGGVRPSREDRAQVVPGLPYQLIVAIVGENKVSVAGYLADWTAEAQLIVADPHVHCIRDHVCIPTQGEYIEYPLCAGCAS